MVAAAFNTPISDLEDRPNWEIETLVELMNERKR